MDSIRTAQVLSRLDELRGDHEISIIRLSEPISSTATAADDSRQRTSDASNASLDAPTPASLEADLTHYKELFSKLRFSYVEQVTKEKFIRAIIGDPPLIVTPQENLDIERENLAAKAQLKALKIEVADTVTQLEKKGRELSQRYENVQLGTIRLRELPDKIAHLEERIADLRAEQSIDSDAAPNMGLPLARTQELVEERQRRIRELDLQLGQLRSQLPRKRKELERLEAELQPLELKRQTSTAAAKEARRRKEAALGGVEDDLEERGRWWRANEALLGQMLDTKS